MKKAVIILVSLLYMVGVLHLSVSFHHCGKQLKYISLFNEEKTCCSKDGGKNHCCCEDKVVEYSVDDQDNYKTAYTFTKIFQLPAAIPFKSLQIIIPQNSLFEVYAINHSPPLISSLRLHIFNCVFLI